MGWSVIISRLTDLFFHVFRANCYENACALVKSYPWPEFPADALELMKVKLVDRMWLQRTAGPQSVSSRILLEVYMLLALTPKLMNVADEFLFNLFFLGSTWWELEEENVPFLHLYREDLVGPVWTDRRGYCKWCRYMIQIHKQFLPIHSIKKKYNWEVSIYVNVGDVWYPKLQKCRIPATFSQAINTGCSLGVEIIYYFIFSPRCCLICFTMTTNVFTACIVRKMYETNDHDS